MIPITKINSHARGRQSPWKYLTFFPTPHIVHIISKEAETPKVFPENNNRNITNEIIAPENNQFQCP
jgi:hypothetical protein